MSGREMRNIVKPPFSSFVHVALVYRYPLCPCLQCLWLWYRYYEPCHCLLRSPLADNGDFTPTDKPSPSSKLCLLPRVSVHTVRPSLLADCLKPSLMGHVIPLFAPVANAKIGDTRGLCGVNSCTGQRLHMHTHTLTNTNTSTLELNCILHMYGIIKAIYSRRRAFTAGH